MAEKREVILTELASEHIHSTYTLLLEEGATQEAEDLMNDFLDVVFGEIPYHADRFPVCEGVDNGSDNYRIGSLAGDFRVIFQVFATRVLILLILHESELPF
jgi:plasmid stabilization system protein ParE